MKKLLGFIILSFFFSVSVSANEERWVRLLSGEDPLYPGYFYKVFVDLNSIKTGEEWGMKGELFYQQLNAFEKPIEDQSGNLTLFTNLLSYEVNCSEVKKRKIFSQWYDKKIFNNKESFNINLFYTTPVPDTRSIVTENWEYYDKEKPKAVGKVTIREICLFKGIKIKESTKGFEIKDPFEGKSPEEKKAIDDLLNDSDFMKEVLDGIEKKTN
jgi:hypothetical protein